MKKKTPSKEELEKLITELYYNPIEGVTERKVTIWGWGYYKEDGTFHSALLESIDKAMKEKAKDFLL